MNKQNPTIKTQQKKFTRIKQNQTFRTFWMFFSLQKYFRQSVTSAHILKVQIETNAILGQSSGYIHSSSSLLLHASSLPSCTTIYKIHIKDILTPSFAGIT